LELGGLPQKLALEILSLLAYSEEHYGKYLAGGGNTFMAYQMTVTLTDQEYQLLTAEAARRGEPPETLLRALIRHLESASTEKHPMTGRELAEKLYREGKLASLATPRPLTQEEQQERQRLARLFASDKLASEMVIEDRGPY
jgi:hypothetical protein